MSESDSGTLDQTFPGLKLVEGAGGLDFLNNPLHQPILFPAQFRLEGHESTLEETFRRFVDVVFSKSSAVLALDHPGHAKAVDLMLSRLRPIAGLTGVDRLEGELYRYTLADTVRVGAIRAVIIDANTASSFSIFDMRSPEKYGMRSDDEILIRLIRSEGERV